MSVSFRSTKARLHRETLSHETENQTKVRKRANKMASGTEERHSPLGLIGMISIHPWGPGIGRKSPILATCPLVFTQTHTQINESKKKKSSSKSKITGQSVGEGMY